MLSILSSPRLWLLALMAIFFAAQPWHRDAGVTAFQLICLFSTCYLFLFRTLIDRVRELKVLAIGVSGIAAIAVLSWIFREYDEAPIRAVKPYIFLLSIVPIVFLIRIQRIKTSELAFVLIVAGVSMLVYGTQQFVTGYTGRWDGVENAVEFGNYAAVMACLSLLLGFGLVRDRLSWLIRITLFIVGAAELYITYKSGTRSSLGVVLVAVLIGLAYFSVVRRSWVIVLTLFLVSLLSMFMLKDTPRAKFLQSEVVQAMDGGYASGSLGQRFEMWRLATCLAGEFPLLGVGGGGFKYAQLDSWKSDCDVKITARKGYYHQAHSVYFHTLATMGYLGLIAMLGMLITLVTIGLRYFKSSGALLLFTVLSFMAAGLTVDLYFKDFMVARFILLISIGVCLISRAPGGQSTTTPADSKV